MTGHPGQNGIQTIGKTIRIASIKIRIIGEFIRHIPQKALNVLCAEKGGD
ncbi:hypothetical protein AA0229_0170 [Gluconobacter cerinus NRIC 0229]|nr:hypothetical protein AA0229_0170 [Gluconobacter cerinus NRIC 0229]